MAQKPVDVSTLNKYIARIMQTDPVIGNISVVGEISNLKYHSSGHIYFSLKDDRSTVRCFMSVVYVSELRYRLEDGMEVVVSGFVSVFERGGYYSLNVKSVDISGEGNLAAAFKAMYRKLENEGLFDKAHKKKLPHFPGRVCVITSETGAALRDIIKIIKNRNTLTDIIVYPALVQGTNAAADLAAAIEDVNKSFADTDVIIIGRGGGSAEDLWAFNEEILARAVYASDIPVISAVGHETDFSICDFAADVRAETPTAAAAIAVPDIRDIKAVMEQYVKTIHSCLKRLFDLEASELNRYSHIYFDRHMRAAVQKREMALERFSPESFAARISSMVENRSLRADALFERIKAAFAALLEKREASVENYGKMLDISDPEAIVMRGYAIVREHDTGKVITSAADAEAGKKIDIKLKDGIIESEITGIGAG